MLAIRATMMTGRYMHVLGHRTQIHLIRAYEENYWRLLKEAGYHVKWLGKNDALSKARSICPFVMGKATSDTIRAETDFVR